MGQNVISFSLWGNNTKYTIGAIKNAELALKYYPGWVCRFYIGQFVSVEIVDSLYSFSNVQIVMMKEFGNWNTMFWRFLAADDSDKQNGFSYTNNADSFFYNKWTFGVKMSMNK